MPRDCNGCSRLRGIPALSRLRCSLAIRRPQVRARSGRSRSATAVAMSGEDSWSTVLCTLSATRPSGVSAALIALMISAISSAQLAADDAARRSRRGTGPRGPRATTRSFGLDARVGGVDVRDLDRAREQCRRPWCRRSARTPTVTPYMSSSPVGPYGRSASSGAPPRVSGVADVREVADRHERVLVGERLRHGVRVLVGRAGLVEHA